MPAGLAYTSSMAEGCLGADWTKMASARMIWLGSVYQQAGLSVFSW